MLACLFERRGHTEDVGVRTATEGVDGSELRNAFGYGPRFVDDDGIDAFEPLERFGIFHEDAARGASAGTDHDGHRRGQTERARTRDDQHRDGADKGQHEARLRPPDTPRHKRGKRACDDGWHEVRRNPIGQPLNRRAAALRLGDHPHDLCNEGIRAHAFGADQERTA